MEIPPPPPPSPEDVPPPGSYPGMPPPAPGSSPYDGLPSYPQAPYGQQGAYGQQQPYGGQPPYGPGAPGPGPYGTPYAGQNPYGPQPYGAYPQGGWYAPQLTTNGMAIASLVTAFSCVPLLGAILGIVSLRQIKRNHQKGKGLAIAGVTLSGLGTLLVALIITLGVLGAFDEGNTRVENLRPGQCFNTVGKSLSDYGGDGARSTTVDVVGCEKSHDAEAFAVFALDAESGGDYPGVDRISAIAETKCAAYASDYTGDTPLPGSMDIYYYMPPSDGWSRGDHSVTCFFGGTQGKVSGSVKDGGKGSGVGV